MVYLELIAHVTSHIPEKGQVIMRCYGLCANAHRGKVKKASLELSPLLIAEEEPRRLPAKGWAEMIRWGRVQILWNLLRVPYSDPLVCPKCQGRMGIIASLTDYAVADWSIHHLKLTFIAEKPPPDHIFEQTALMAAEESAVYD